MANTFQDDIADAGQTDFAFTFEYLEDEHVKVFVDGVEQALTTNFTIDLTSTKKIVLSNPTTPLTGGEIVRVRRISDPATDLVDFVNGSVLTESELDRAYLHNRYLAEESAEQNDVSMRLTAGATGFDALNKKIFNVVDPTSDQDAATKNYVDETVAGVALGTVPDGSITAAKLDTDAVTTAKIEDGAVTAAKLDTDSVTNAKIQDNAVTAAKISSTDSTFSIDGSGNMGLGIAANSAAKLYIAGTGGNTFLAVKSDTMAAIDLEDNGAGTDQKHYQMVSLDGTFEVRQINDDLTLKATPLKVDSSGNIDASGVYKVGGSNLLLDEDTMTSNSATQGATQQSIKAYVDSQSSGVQVKCSFDGTASSPTADTGAVNVASITKTATGDYTVNFTSSVSNPVASVSVVNASTSNPVDVSMHTIGTTSVRIITGTNSGGRVDYAGVHLLVF